MGKKLPGITLAFENPKGGVGKSTLTALFAGYVHSMGEDGINIEVVLFPMLLLLYMFAD